MAFSADFVLIFKIRSSSARSDLKNKSARFSGIFAKNMTPKNTVKPGKNTNSIRPGILFVFFGFVFVS